MDVNSNLYRLIFVHRIMEDSNFKWLPQFLIVLVEQTEKSQGLGNSVPSPEECNEKWQISTLAIKVEIEKGIGRFQHRKASGEIWPEN